MSAVANQNQIVTVTLAWREPNGQVIQFGAGSGGSAPAPAATSSGSSNPSGQGSGHPAAGSNAVDLFA